jgi:RES domain-containing protein
VKRSAWRIVQREHLAEAFTGEGARLYGGRWNSLGVSVVYAAGSISLAVLEMLVHLQGAGRLPDYRLIEAQFDESLIQVLNRARLPRGWRWFPPPTKLRQMADRWVRAARSAVLQVPSVLTGEPNFLLNPAHPDFARIRIGKPVRLALDTRLLPDSLRPYRK